MSIYSTLFVTQAEAIKLIAEHLIANTDHPDLLKNRSTTDLLESILFKLTNSNVHSPYKYCNYIIVSDQDESSLVDFKEENFLK